MGEEGGALRVKTTAVNVAAGAELAPLPRKSAASKRAGVDVAGTVELFLREREPSPNERQSGEEGGLPGLKNAVADVAEQRWLSLSGAGALGMEAVVAGGTALDEMARAYPSERAEGEKVEARNSKTITAAGVVAVGLEKHSPNNSEQNGGASGQSDDDWLAPRNQQNDCGRCGHKQKYQE